MVTVGVGDSVGGKVGVADKTGVGGIVLVAVGSLLNRFNFNPPPLMPIMMITRPNITRIMDMIARNTGRDGLFFRYESITF